MTSFRYLCKQLRKEHPTKHPVRIYVRKKLDDLGGFDEWYQGGKIYFTIKVKQGPEAYMIHTLLEEYAHALAWPDEVCPHDMVWAEQFSKLRIWFQQHPYWRKRNG